MATAAEYSKQPNRSDHRGLQEEIIGGGGSRFDDLPDHILHDILSSLDIKFAGRTSSLSRRWRNTWKDISVLNLSTAEYTWRSFRPCIIAKALQSLSSAPTVINFKIESSYRSDRVRSELDLFDSVMKFAAASSTTTGRPVPDLSIARAADSGLGLGQIVGRIVAHGLDQSLETLRLEAFPLVDFIVETGFHLLTTLELRRCKFYSVELPSFENLPGLKCLKLVDCKSYNPAVTVSVVRV